MFERAADWQAIGAIVAIVSLGLFVIAEWKKLKGPLKTIFFTAFYGFLVIGQGFLFGALVVGGYAEGSIWWEIFGVIMGSFAFFILTKIGSKRALWVAFVGGFTFLLMHLFGSIYSFDFYNIGFSDVPRYIWVLCSVGPVIIGYLWWIIISDLSDIITDLSDTA